MIAGCLSFLLQRRKHGETKERWVDDLDKLFTSNLWRHVGADELFYEYTTPGRDLPTGHGSVGPDEISPHSQRLVS